VANLYVNNLLCPNEKSWDGHKIRSLFPSYIANSILAVPLFDDVVEDHLVWDDDMHGSYTVKSGYNLLLKTQIDTVTNQGNEDWKWLWKIHAPPKTKHLLWRICKGILPTRLRLQQRHVPCPLTCPLCDYDVEDDWHILFGCESSLSAWHVSGLYPLIAAHIQQGCTVKDLILHICRRIDRNDAGQVAVLLWTLWNNRNNWVWHQDKEQGQQLGFKAIHVWQEWSAVQRVFNNGANQLQQQQNSWQPPPIGKYKCNVDAGIHADARKTSAGWCVRDHRGHFVLGGSSWINGRCSSSEGEALALLEAMKELQQRGFTNVTFETDAYNIVCAIRRRVNGVSEFSSIINNIKCLLSLNTGFEVKPIRRQANRIAHTIARAALSWSRRHIFELLPHCINNLLYNEMI
jgi:ribonuclease HI